jgi:hypothetical protein
MRPRAPRASGVGGLNDGVYAQLEARVGIGMSESMRARTNVLPIPLLRLSLSHFSTQAASTDRHCRMTG